MSTYTKFSIIIKHNVFYKFILGQTILIVLFFCAFFCYKKFLISQINHTGLTIESIDLEINQLKYKLYDDKEAEIDALEATKMALKSRDASSISEKLTLLKQSTKMFEACISKSPNNPLLRVNRLNTFINVPVFLRDYQKIDQDLDALEHWLHTNNLDSKSEKVHFQVCSAMTLWKKNQNICNKKNKTMENKSVN